MSLKGTLIFSATDATHGDELWKSDGTGGGTVLLKDINPGVTGSRPRSLTVVGNTVFFTATDATHGTELWKTDGTARARSWSRTSTPAPSAAIPRTW